jgi:ADP-ribose pyrophosphatase
MANVKVISSETVYKGKLLTLRVDRIQEPPAGETTREIVMSPNAVCVVARPTPKEVILIRQYRHATGETLIEVPAGGLKPGEDPKHAAIRELEEETGYLAATITDIGGFRMTPGFTTEFMYAYEATGLTKTQTNPDEDEIIEVDIVSNEQVLAMIADGRIQDSKSIASLLKVLSRG